MDTGNTRHFVSNRISKRERQRWNGRSNKTKRSDYVKRKENISKRIIFRISKDLRISFSIKYRLSDKRKKKIKV